MGAIIHDATWTNVGADTDWKTVTNWDPNPGAGDWPGDGSILTFDKTEGGNALPTMNQPAAGTLDFIISADYTTKGIDGDILGSAGAAIGAVTITAAGIIMIDANFTSVSTAGTLIVKDNLTVQGDVELDGGALSAAGAAAKLDGALTVTANDGTINWGSGNLAVDGSVNAGGNALTHTNPTGSTLTCDTTANLDPGGDAGALAITVNGGGGATTVTATANVDCGVVTITDANDVLNLAAKTLDCAGFTFTNGTWQGSATVTVAGNATRTAGTNSHTGLFRHGGGNLAWASIAQPLAHVALGYNGKSTLTAAVYAKEITISGGDGSGDAVAGAFDLFLLIYGNDKWHQDVDSGTVKCESVNAYLTLDAEIGGMDLSGCLGAAGEVLQVYGGADDKTLTATAPIDCGTGDILLRELADTKWVKLAMVAQTLECRGTVYLGEDAANKGGGKADLGTGTHIIGSIEKSANSNAVENAVDTGSSSTTLSGTMEGTGITFANTAGEIISGIMDNCDFSAGPITHYWPQVAGTGNTDVTEVSPACSTFQAPYASEYKSFQSRPVSVIKVFGNNTTAKTVAAAVPGCQLWVIGGHVSVSDTTNVLLKSGAAGTVTGQLNFVKKGTYAAPLCCTEAGALLEIKLSATAEMWGRLYVVAVAQGDSLPVLKW